MSFFLQNMKIIGTQFKGLGNYGDFNFMINTKIENGERESLFLYNDNEECFRLKSFNKGKGNAIIRTYNQYNPRYNECPYSAGIPTGPFKNRGYKSLSDEVKLVIDESFENIHKLIDKHKYSTIYYSSYSNGKLGMSLFRVSDDVIDYITKKIFQLSL